MSRIHHYYSPSSLNYRRTCPAWSPWQSADTKAADEGASAHAQVEAGRATEDRAVQFCQAFIEARKQELGQLGPVEEHREQRLVVKDREGNDLTYGYADCILVSGHAAELIDFKFGLLPVPPPAANAQLLAYALGIKDRWPQVAAVRVWVVQPRVNYVEDHTFFFSEANLEHLRQELEDIITQAKKADLDEATWGVSGRWRHARPNTSACLYCGHLLQCEPVQKHLQVLNQIEDLMPAQTSLQVSDYRTEEDVASALDFVRWLQQWLKRWWANVVDLVLSKRLPAPKTWRLRNHSRLEVADTMAWTAWVERQLTPDKLTQLLQHINPQTVLKIFKADQKTVDEALLADNVLRVVETKPFLTKTNKPTDNATHED